MAPIIDVVFLDRNTNGRSGSTSSSPSCVSALTFLTEQDDRKAVDSSSTVTTAEHDTHVPVVPPPPPLALSNSSRWDATPKPTRLSNLSSMPRMPMRSSLSSPPLCVLPSPTFRSDESSRNKNNTSAMMMVTTAITTEAAFVIPSKQWNDTSCVKDHHKMLPPRSPSRSIMVRPISTTEPSDLES